jgi:diguanylate cyclase (GGDEF)-like protein
MHRMDKRREGSAGLIMLDLDGLKLINDTMGHERGDILLATAAHILSASFRDSDVVARIGGDEFAVLLQPADEDMIQSGCDRIRQKTKEFNAFELQAPISLSIGHAVAADPSVPMRELFQRADNTMYREKLHRRQSTRSAIVQTVMKLLEARDYITEGHADRLQAIVAKMGRALGFPEEKISDLRLFAQFHDIGKVGIPDSILMKPGPLNTEEKTEMQRHSEIGQRIAQSAPDLVPIADWILKHQEWWNGAGYPLGLSGEDIPMACRILAIADAYDAMTSNRPYRQALPHSEAVNELQRCAGSQFDPALVGIFVSLCIEAAKDAGYAGEKGAEEL